MMGIWEQEGCDEPRRMIPAPWRFPARTVCGCKSTIDTKLGSSADGVLLDRGTVEEMCLRWIVRDTDGAGLALKH